MLTRIMLVIGLSGAGPLAAREAAKPIVPQPAQFVALSVPDAAASVSWYSEAFGLRLLAEIKPPNGDLVYILTSDALLVEILQLGAAKSPGEEAVQNPHFTHGLFKVGFHVSDLDGAVAKLKGMKAEFETDIIDDTRHDLRFVLLRDPHGNYLQLFGKPRKPRTVN